MEWTKECIQRYCKISKAWEIFIILFTFLQISQEVNDVMPGDTRVVKVWCFSISFRLPTNKKQLLAEWPNAHLKLNFNDRNVDWLLEGKYQPATYSTSSMLILG